MKLYIASYGYRDCDPIGSVAAKTKDACERAIRQIRRDEELDSISSYAADEEVPDFDFCVYGPIAETETFVREQLGPDDPASLTDFENFLTADDDGVNVFHY